jgi:hypothetical protein
MTLLYSHLRLRLKLLPRSSLLSRIGISRDMCVGLWINHVTSVTSSRMGRSTCVLSNGTQCCESLPLSQIASEHGAPESKCPLP